MPKKQTTKESKPRAKTARKKRVEPERLAPMLAAEAELVCRQYRQVRPGKFERCANPATRYIPGAGDACDSHPRSKTAIRYATTRLASVSKAA